jgi:type II secretory pathway predicted ATPase ExeA
LVEKLIEELKKKVGFDAEALQKLDMIKVEASEAMKQANLYEKQLKHVENFTNSYSQKSFSNFDMNNTSAFKSMMYMLEDLYENEDVINTTKVYHNFKESNLHFCLMFASPLVIFRDTLAGLKLQTIPWEIEYTKDLARIKKTLKNVGCDIKFLSAKASVSTFVDIMKKNPMILHFCGHGIDNTRGAKVARSLEENVDNYYLVFEDHLGRGELVSTELLASMIASSYKVNASDQNKNSLEFVFVASCHSEVTAQVFLTAGASHVVCVSKDEKISDDICNTFAEYYYQAFFCESLTFCEAFEFAKRKVAAGVFFNGEEKKFKMLINHSNTGRHCHKCTRFISKPSVDSRFIDFTPVPLFNVSPFLHECFLGRNREIYELIDLLHHNRFVVLKGMIGVGKSSLQKEIANKLGDRGMFEHGIIYMDLKNDTSLERMHSVFMSDLTINKLVRKKSGTKDYDLNQAASDIAAALADYNVLLIFDNVDSLYVRAANQLKLFFENVINQTKGVKIFISLFSKIDNIQGNFSEKVYELGPLSDHDSAQLLLKRATRRVNEVEILQLFNDQRDQYTGKPTLESHKLIKLFNGMPQIILMAASILHERTLSDLYVLLTSNTSQYQLRPLISEVGNHHLIENSVSLALDIVEQIGEKDNLKLVTFFPSRSSGGRPWNFVGRRQQDPPTAIH